MGSTSHNLIPHKTQNRHRDEHNRSRTPCLAYRLKSYRCNRGLTLGLVQQIGALHSQFQPLHRKISDRNSPFHALWITKIRPMFHHGPSPLMRCGYLSSGWAVLGVGFGADRPRKMMPGGLMVGLVLVGLCLQASCG